MFIITIKRDACKGCGLCIEFCPRGLIVLDPELNQRGVQPAMVGGEPETCTGCGNCAAMCPEAIIEIEEVAEAGAPTGPGDDEDEA